MKKFFLLALVLCTVLGAGTLIAADASAPVEASTTLELTDVLPQTVLDQVTVAANPNCPRDILCPAVYDPVICNDGVVYSNSCVAYRECAKGCKPYGTEI